MDPNELWQQQRFIIRGSNLVVIDAGANTGQSVEDYRRWWPDAEVHCFEPDPRAFEVLRNKWGEVAGVSVHPEALGAVEGRVHFNLGKESYASSILSNIPNYNGGVPTVASTEVSVVTLDKFLVAIRAPYVNLLKMDLQGFELEALKGAEDALKEEAIDIIYTEIQLNPVYLGAPQYWQVAQYLANFGYKTWYIVVVDYRDIVEGRWGDAIFVSDRYAKILGY